MEPARPATTYYVNVAAEVGLVLSHDIGVPCANGGPPLGSGSAWADYDNDGDIDRSVTNNGGGNHLYRNDGDTDGAGLPTFPDRAVGAGGPSKTAGSGGDARQQELS